MKLASLLLIFALVMVACSPEADTTVQDNNDTVEVIENTTNEAQSVEPTATENTDSSDEAMDEDNEMESEEANTDGSMDESEEHSGDMDSDEDMTEMDDSEDNETDMVESESEEVEMASDNTEVETAVIEMADTETTEADTSMTIAYSGPDWANVELVNAKTGETFTFADFAGKTVFVEPMATWCSNCRNQQRRIKDVVDQLSTDEYVIMSLSVETYLSAGELADYANNLEFGWTFAVASDELVNALVAEFGRGVSNPPSVPHFTINPDGSAISFTTGSKTGEEFLALVRAVADGS